MDRWSINTAHRTTTACFSPYPLNEIKPSSFVPNQSQPTTCSCCSRVPYINEVQTNSFIFDSSTLNRKPNVEPTPNTLSTSSSPNSQPITPIQYEYNLDFDVPHQLTQPSSVGDALCPTTPNSPSRANPLNDFILTEPIHVYLNEISTTALQDEIDILVDTYLSGRNETTSTTNDNTIDYNVILNFLYSDDLATSIMCED